MMPKQTVTSVSGPMDAFVSGRAEPLYLADDASFDCGCSFIIAHTKHLLWDCYIQHQTILPTGLVREHLQALPLWKRRVNGNTQNDNAQLRRLMSLRSSILLFSFYFSFSFGRYGGILYRLEHMYCRSTSYLEMYVCCSFS